MSRRSLYACIYVPQPAPRRGALVEVAQEFSSRIEAHDDERLVLLDVSGLERLVGDAQAIGLALGRAAVGRGLAPRVAVAATRVAAWLVAGARPGVTVVPPGAEATVVAPLPIGALEALVETRPRVPSRFRPSAFGIRHIDLPSLLDTLSRWGLKTLGDLAALPPAALAARVGPAGPALCRIARGDDPQPLVPDLAPERFEASLDLEWPIVGLEPLSFVLARVLEPLCAQLARADRGAAALSLRLRLVTREIHERTLSLPAPLVDPRVLRTLLLLDLESHPPAAGIDRVTVEAEPSPGRVVQYSLIEHPLPSPDELTTLLARLDALMGAGRSGAPALVDSHEPGAFAMAPFAGGREPHTGDGSSMEIRGAPVPLADQRPTPGALRRFRVPIVATVVADEGRPARVTTGRRSLAGGRVEQHAGPWRTSGQWWDPAAWDRDEWDVLLADGVVYRLSRDRTTGRWAVEGIVD